ncbi:hypothetical protein CEXT_284021 [Caerostris extrusa]|uniref:Protein BANP n=1 Tax=Caerostris extrusa TaxID=172846 RepID=A0AAV4U507_CAEEX|nr:hypothetical protein CEXT_284021 [Caerostris extrusa]
MNSFSQDQDKTHLMDSVCKIGSYALKKSLPCSLLKNVLLVVNKFQPMCNSNLASAFLNEVYRFYKTENLCFNFKLSILSCLGTAVEIEVLTLLNKCLDVHNVEDLDMLKSVVLESCLPVACAENLAMLQKANNILKKSLIFTNGNPVVGYLSYIFNKTVKSRSMSPDTICLFCEDLFHLEILFSLPAISLHLMEPPAKILRIDDSELKEMLLNMQSSFHNKLKNIEEKIEKMGSKYHMLERKVENILINIKESALKVSCPKFANVSSDSNAPKFMSVNCEEAYPNGSWLGDPNNSDLRVRCHIDPIDLQTINNSCPTAEKMALTLLDHLFDRETQARSNISGSGKHGKEQLDPLKIYGIKCHVMNMFGINHKEWTRIRQNIDSKCRFAFRRKQKGLPLTVKRCRDRMAHTNGPSIPQINGGTLPNSSLLEQNQIIEQNQNLVIPKEESTQIEYFRDQTLTIQKEEPTHIEYFQEHDLSEIIPLKLDPDAYSITFTEGIATQIIHTELGDIQVIQGTEEQLEQLKQNHNIEILSPSDLLTDPILNVTE